MTKPPYVGGRAAAKFLRTVVDERDDDAHEAWTRESGRVEPDDPYRHAPLGSPFSDD